jgi:peptidoglycan/xylan/chitin deacetylase (PgdA/CDA1 family)
MTQRSGAITACPNPLTVPDSLAVGATTLRWESTGTQIVEIRVGAPDGPLLSRATEDGSVTTGEWVSDGMTFFLQDVSGEAPLTTEHTLATTQVRVKSEVPTLGLILMYHRVTEIGLDPWSLAVTPRHFAEQMAALREIARPCELRQLSRALQNHEEIDPLSVAVTFDDGYADNLHQAKPWLERYDISATIFVTSDYVGSNRDFWWDALDCLLLAERLPPTLRLTIAGKEHLWHIESPEASANDGAVSHHAWRAPREADSHPHWKLYYELHGLLKPLPEKERLDIIDQLLEWTGAAHSGREAYRQLTGEELHEMARGGLVEIGSHTLTHPDLQSMPRHAQWDEILQSRNALSEMIERPVMSFAYPYGALSPETPTLVQTVGYECACSTSSRSVTRKTDRFQMPRLMVGDWSGEEFGRRLIDWLQ